MPPSSKFKGGANIGEFKPLTKEERQKARDLRELAAMVPKKAALAVSEQEHPHVSSRMDCLDLRDGYEAAEYITVRRGHRRLRLGPRPRALASGEYVEMARRPGFQAGTSSQKAELASTGRLSMEMFASTDSPQRRRFG